MKKNSIFSKERKKDLEKMMSRVRELVLESEESKKNEERISKSEEKTIDEAERDFMDLREKVLKEITKDEVEEELHIEKDLLGRPVIAEADDEQQQDTEEGNQEQQEEQPQQEQEDSKEGEEKNDDSNKDDKEKEEEEKGPLKDGETTHLQSFDELFKETDTKLKIQKETSEPSPLFGENSKNHDKYKITLTNNKGGDLMWYYWQSEKNTENNVVPDTETVMKDFGKKLEAVVVGISFDNFKKDFGYDNVEEQLAQKQYDALRKLKDQIKKIYPDQHNVYQLIQLAKKD